MQRLILTALVIGTVRLVCATNGRPHIDPPSQEEIKREPAAKPAGQTAKAQQEDNFRDRQNVIVDPPPPVKRPAKPPEAQHWNPLGKILKPVNQQGVGKISGQLQFLALRNTFDGEGLSNGTAGATLRYHSPRFKGLLLGLEYIHVGELFDGGTLKPARGAGWATCNDDFHVLSEAYLDLELGLIGLEKTKLKVGRFMSTYEFAPSYRVFQKAQHIQGAALRCNEVKQFSLELGHIQKFSGWSGRDRDGDWFTADFSDVEDVVTSYRPRS